MATISDSARHTACQVLHSGPRVLLGGERKKDHSAREGKEDKQAGGWPGLEPRQKNMRVERNRHAPETGEIFPPVRPAHDYQKGAQIMEKIHLPKASMSGRFFILFILH